jgi:hypothetical protein
VQSDHIHFQLTAEQFRTDELQRPADRDAGIVHQAAEPVPVHRTPDGFCGGSDLGGVRDIEQQPANAFRGGRRQPFTILGPTHSRENAASLACEALGASLADSG